MKKCLVLGAGGFIGRNLCMALAGQYEVIAFDIKGLDNLQNINNVDIVQGNFQNIEEYSTMFDDVSIVYHLICTALPTENTSNIPNEIQNNLIPLGKLLEILVKKNIEQFIFISSAGTVYGESEEISVSENNPLNPICSYGVLKKVSEEYINFYNMRYRKSYKIVRVSNPYGIGQDVNRPQGIIPVFVMRLLKKNPITVWGNGENTRDYIYMSDLIDALVEVGKYKGEETVFNVGSGISISTNDIIQLIEKVVGEEFDSVDYVDARACDVMHNCINISKFTKETGWNPATNLEDGIRSILTYYKEIC